MKNFIETNRGSGVCSRFCIGLYYFFGLRLDGTLLGQYVENWNTQKKTGA